MKTLSKITLSALLILGLAAGCQKNDEVQPETSSTSVQKKYTEQAIQAPISGTVNGDVFTGTLRITEFITDGDSIYAVGQIAKLKGIKKNTDVYDLLSNYEFQLPVSFGSEETSNLRIAQSCDILNLELGPLHLDLLGLVIDLNQVNLDITAESGSGNLLGNLLCAIAGLLDPLSDLFQIVDLLNQLVDLIGSFNP